MQFWVNWKMNLAIQEKLGGYCIGYEEAYIDTNDNSITFMGPCGPDTQKLPDDLIFILEEDGTITVKEKLFGKI